MKLVGRWAYRRGRTLEAAGDLQAAVDAYERAVAHGYRQGSTLFRIGYVFERLERWDDAASAYARALTGPVDEMTERLLDGVEDLLHPGHAREDGRHAVRRRWQEADEHLTRLTQGGHVSARALSLHARLASRLSRWGEAATRWERLARCFPEARTEALVGLARVRRRLDDLEGAEDALAAIDDRDTDRRSVRRERQGLQVRVAAVESARLMAGVVDALRSGRHEDAVRQAAEALEWRSYSTAQVREVTSVIAALSSLVDASFRRAARAASPSVREPSDEGEAHLQPPAIIVVGGFGWTGSGAVADFLRGFEGVTVPYDKPEVGCFDKPPPVVSAKNVLRRVQAGDGAVESAVVDFVLTSVLGSWFPGVDPTRYEVLGRTALLHHFADSDAATATLCGATRRLVADVQRVADGTGEQAHAGLMTSLQRFFDRITASKVAADRYGLIDNAIHAHNFELVPLFSNVRAVAVFRDPRDQFVSYRQEKDPDLSSEKFIEDMRSRLRRFERAASVVTPSVPVLCVQFEHFVEQEDVRTSLLASLGMTSRPGISASRSFDSAKSRQNIGLHRTHHQQADMARIEQELGEHLPSASPTPFWQWQQGARD